MVRIACRRQESHQDCPRMPREPRGRKILMEKRSLSEPVDIIPDKTGAPTGSLTAGLQLETGVFRSLHDSNFPARPTGVGRWAGLAAGSGSRFLSAPIPTISLPIFCR